MTVMARLPQQSRLTDLAAAAEGRLHGEDRAFAGVEIDTRRLSAGHVFFALHGEHADGHAFVPAAVQAGAVAAVVERSVDAGLPQIHVTDTQAALQLAAARWRQAFSGSVVGITGSNGKTTVRRMLAAITARLPSPWLATRGNFNNHLGVPLTLLRLRAGHAGAIVEMGANHAGEIEQLARLARPGVGVITNAGDAHLEGFGSRDGVARAKGELYEQLPVDGTAVINADDAYADQWRATASHCRTLCFSLDGAPAAVRGSAVELNDGGSRFVLHVHEDSVTVTLPMPGEHNVRNALAAAAVAAGLGIAIGDIADGLGSVSSEPGRLVAVSGIHASRLVDDSYNANPASLRAALNWLSGQTGPRWLVLGDMGELGGMTDQAHHEAGEQARAAGVDRLWAVGEKSRLAAESFGSQDDWRARQSDLGQALVRALTDHAGRPPIVLIKGSRSARMDRIVSQLKAADALGGTSC